MTAREAADRLWWLGAPARDAAARRRIATGVVLLVALGLLGWALILGAHP